jgi:hypothetical protein
MPKRLNLRRTIKANPEVNAKELKEGLEEIRKLREAGFTGKLYNLRVPFSREASERHSGDYLDNQPGTED